MPNLDMIAGLINDSLKSGNFNSRRFQAAKFYEIADPIKTFGEDKERKEPYVINNSGEGEAVVYDDTNAFQVYHVVDTIGYAIPTDDYGKPGTTMQESADMRMIFAGSRNRMKVTNENAIAACTMDFPKEFLPSQITTMGMNSCIIEMQSVESDPYVVWADQFVGTQYPLGTDTILFSIKYRIVDTFNKKCFSLC